MDTQSQLTIAQVVANVINQAAISSGIVAAITYAVAEFIKKIPFKGGTIPTWVAALCTAPIGILTTFLLQGAKFTPLGILVGILASLGPAGVYSIGSSVKKAVTGNNTVTVNKDDVQATDPVVQ